MMKYIILLTISIILHAQEWNYSADILEKKIENDREVRIFKSTELGNNQVIIYNDTISIFTKQAKQYIDNEPFLLTYGDGLANVDIGALIDFHRSHGKMVTITAVHPGARFGELEINGEQVSSFKEKPQTTQGWINGGYFLIEPEFFDLIDGDKTILEKWPLEKAAEIGELMAYRHYGFWKCMDTKRDRDFLEDMWKSGNPLWSM